MIKINLLSEGRRPVVARKSRPTLNFGGQEPNNVLLMAGLVLGVLIAGGWWYRMHSEFKALQRDVRSAQARYEELRPIIEQVNAFKANKESLENKVKVIKDLKAGQKGPVFAMDAVSRSLPELLWLDTMTVIGPVVTVQGSAFNTNAIATFIENLYGVVEFEEPDPRNIRTSANKSADNVYTFQLTLALKPPKPLEGEDEG